MNAIQLTNNLKSYISSQLDTMASNTPIIAFMKPILTRTVDKGFNKVANTLSLLADEDGNIDVEGILSEMADSLVSTKPFIFNTGFIGDIEIGGGLIKLNIPLTNKRLVFNKSDIENIKEVLITNKE